MAVLNQFQKMKSENLVLAVAVATAVTSGAFAQVFNYSDTDLLLAVRQDSNPNTDLVIDLGPVSNLSSIPTSITSAYQITRTTTLSGNNTGDTISSALHQAYGTSLSGLDFSLLSTDGLGNGNLYLSRLRTTATFGPASAIKGSTAWVRGTGTSQNTPVSKIVNLGNAAATQNSNGTSVADGVTAGNGWVSFPSSIEASYTKATTTTTGGLKSYVSSGLEGKYNGSSVSLDFYSVQAKSGANPSVYLGFFTLDSAAHLSFVPAGAVVPETQNYAAVAGLGLIAFAAWRRRSAK